MNGAHLHLLLNHLPVIGVVIGFLLLSAARLRKSAELTKVSLGLLALVALIALPVYITGEPAEEVVEHLPGVSEGLIERHEQAGIVALIAMGITGAVSLAGLLLFRGERKVPSWFAASALALSVISAVVMGWTANLGGQIRHTEIRGGSSPSPPAEAGGREGKQKNEQGEREHGE